MEYFVLFIVFIPCFAIIVVVALIAIMNYSRIRKDGLFRIDNGILVINYLFTRRVPVKDIKAVYISYISTNGAKHYVVFKLSSGAKVGFLLSVNRKGELERLKTELKANGLDCDLPENQFKL